MNSVREDASSALQELMERHWGGIAEYSYRMLSDSEDAKDVAQEVFASVWEHRKRWSACGSVRAYLHRIARNLTLNRLRRRKIRIHAKEEIELRLPRVPTPLENVSNREVLDALEAALADLPPRRREAFVLVRVQGLSLAEAAEVMGVIPQTVANQAYRAALDLGDALASHLD